MDRIDDYLDAFERSCGIPAVGEDEVTVEAKRLLSLPPSLLPKMTPEQCAEGAFVLFQFAFRLQQLSNRESARAEWAEESVKKLISRSLDRFQGGFDERRLKAISSVEAAIPLDAERVRSRLKASRIAYLSQKADALGRAMMNLRQARTHE